MAATVDVYEQDCHGKTHFRVMRRGYGNPLIFGRHQTDFPNESEAVAAVRGEFRRNKLGDVEIVVHRQS